MGYGPRAMTTPVFSPAERERLNAHFSDVDGDIFVLTNLPEAVKGALYARYSRSHKSLKRLFIDEFAGDVVETGASVEAAEGRAAKLYEKVFVEYGDDSVAQLGGVHLAVEGASNVLTKVLEWGRLMAYLEQSTRYIPYTDKPNGKYRYVTPRELDAHPQLLNEFNRTMDFAFDTYSTLLEKMNAFFQAKYPREEGVSEGAWKRSLKAKALDTVRGLLPSATKSNVGIYGTGQAYEALLLRMRAHESAEMRDCADLMLVELRKVIPSFLKRVDQADRGVAWSEYLGQTAANTRALATELLAEHTAQQREEVTLADWEPDGEAKVVAAALYSSSTLPDDQLLTIAKAMSPEERQRVLSTYVGARTNRRHKPGRAFERTTYRFDVLSDYGAFRDLQRHRMLTVEWQPLSAAHGWVMPDAIGEAGEEPAFREAMEACAKLSHSLEAAGLVHIVPYAIPMAYRLRYNMQFNAREAMHMLELRTAPQGHPSYRRVCQMMHKQIAEVAGHEALAATMRFVDHSDVELERLGSEIALEKKRAKHLENT